MLSTASPQVSANPHLPGVSHPPSRQGQASTRTALQTILLVDDDDDLRMVLEACFSMMGYVVIPCPNAHIAAQAFASSPIDILLTDFQMPGRSGVDLARELTQLRPALPVIIISGSLLSEELTSEIQRRNWTFLAKPCSFTTLLGTMESIFSHSTPTPATASLTRSTLQHPA